MAGEIQLNSVSLATESSGTVTLNSNTKIKGCLNASGSAPIYACRAWINFDGTSASIGTGRANGNVSGVTDNGTGDYTITFTTAMPDANYAFCGSGGKLTTNSIADISVARVNEDASTIRVEVVRGSDNIKTNFETINVAIFR